MDLPIEVSSPPNSKSKRVPSQKELIKLYP